MTVVNVNEPELDLRWRSVGLCLGYDVQMFYPEFGDRRALRFAKAICERCSVLDRCREYSISQREPAGVWGGTDEWERKRHWHPTGSRRRH